MKNRLLSIFAAIAVTLSLSACQNGDTEQTASLSDLAATIVKEAVEMKYRFFSFGDACFFHHPKK